MDTVATALVGGPRLRAQLEGLSEQISRHRMRWLLVLHGVVLVALWGVSFHLLASEPPDGSIWWQALFIVLALGTSVSAVVAAFPPRALVPLVRFPQYLQWLTVRGRRRPQGKATVLMTGNCLL
jgi:hypothetical protein